jgi:hypothetical protein
LFRVNFYIRDSSFYIFRYFIQKVELLYLICKIAQKFILLSGFK